MARGRMINKKISNSRVVNDLPLPVQLLYTWIIPHLDCNGCFYGSAQMIKSLVFPRKNYRKKMIEGWLELLTKSVGNDKNPLIIIYIVEGEQYLFMPGFKGEQIGLRYDKEMPVFPTFDGKMTEEGRKKSAKSPPEVEVEVEQEEEGSSSLSKEDVVEAYERTIGTLSEDMENEVELAIIRFTAQWVSDAIREAVKRNKKTWVYVAGILKNWERFGKDASMPGGHAKRKKPEPYSMDPEKYVQGKYGKNVRR